MKEISPWRIQRIDDPKDPRAEYDYTSAAEQEAHLRDYWKIVVKRRRLLALVLVVVFGIGSYFTLSATALYTATSILKIEPQNPAVTGIQEIVNNVIEDSTNYYGTQFAVLKSRRLAAKVVADLKLDSNDDFTKFSIVSSSIKSRILGNLQYVISLMGSLVPVAPKDTEKPKSTAQTVKGELDAAQPPLDEKIYRWVGRYLGLLTVNPVKGTRLVEVEFATPNAALSQRLANAHARAFILMNMETRQELTKEARQFLDAKNAELKKAVEAAEEKLNQFRQAHGVVSMDKGENIVVERLVELNRKLTDARAQRLEAESLKKTVENKPVLYLSQVITQGLVPALRANLQNLETERVRLSSTFKPDHPRMLELSQQIIEARRSLNAEIASMVKGIEENYGAARAKEQTLQAEAEKQQQMALNLKQVGVEFAVLEEEVKVNRALYESVLNRLHSTSVSNDLAISNMQVLQAAEKPDFPSSPNIPFDLGLCAFLGLFLGLGLIFGLEYLDSAVSTPQHVWRAVALTTFGVVPDLNSLKPFMLRYSRLPGVGLLSRLTPLRLPPPSGPPHELIVEHHPLSIVTEAYRTIRTALLFSQAEKPPQVILLTSPSPGEGKTVTTLNLAIALAQDGYKVLVIDADLRKGCCHTRLGMKNHKGLSNVLTGQLTLEEGIRSTSVSGLSLLSRGVCPPNPGDLLGSNKMRQLLTTLRESFDLILIDSAPAIAVSDAAVTSIMCDGVILVFHGTKTTTASARQAIECLDAVRAPILGAVLNGINLKNPDYAYYRHYYNSDYTLARNGEEHGGEGIVETVAHEEPTEIGPWLQEPAEGMVPHQFFDAMVSKLTEAVGPMAPLIVRDQISLLGESRDAFPKSRLKELLESVSEEIFNNDLRQDFHKSITQELQSL